MKNRITRILSIALSLSLLICFAFVIGSFADNSEAAPAIVKKNVAYGDRVQLLFATNVPASDSDGLKLVYYVQTDGGYEPEQATMLPAGSEDNYTDGGVTYATFITEGVSPSRTTEVVYAAAYTGDTAPAKEDCISYSLAEYFFDRLYKDDVISREDTDTQKALYTEYLDYAEAAIKHFNPSAVALADCGYVVVKDGSHDLASNFVVGDATANLSYSGISNEIGYYHFESGLASWSVKTYDLDGGYTTASLDKDTALAVDGIKVVTPVMAEGGSLPEGVVHTPSNESGTSTAEIVYNETFGSNVLKFSNVVLNSDADKTNSAYNSTLDFQIADSSASEDIASMTVTSSFMITEDEAVASDNEKSGTYRILILDASNAEMTSTIQLASDKYHELQFTVGGASGFSDGTSNCPGGTAVTGRILTLKFEFYTETTDGVTETFCLISFEGYNKAGTTLTTKTSNPISLGEGDRLSEISKIRFRRYDSGIKDTSLYFDNVLVERSVAE